MAVVIKDEMFEASKRLPKEQADAFFGALIRYGQTGEEPKGDEPWILGFDCCKEQIKLRKRQSQGGKKGSKIRWQEGKEDKRGEENEDERN